MNYYKKYQKYRFKYLNLLNQSGTGESEYYKNAIRKVRINGLNLKEVNYEDFTLTFEHEYPVICKNAIDENPNALEFVDKSFIKKNSHSYNNICLFAIEKDSDTLQFVDKSFINKYPNVYYNICLSAIQNYRVKNSGLAIQFVDKNIFTNKLLNDKLNSYGFLSYYNLFNEAIKHSNGLALQYLDKIVVTKELYIKICKEAVKKNSSVLQFVDQNYLSIEEYKEIVETNSSENKYL
jgi:hypothetical protein